MSELTINITDISTKPTLRKFQETSPRRTSSRNQDAKQQMRKEIAKNLIMQPFNFRKAMLEIENKKPKRIALPSVNSFDVNIVGSGDDELHELDAKMSQLEKTQIDPKLIINGINLKLEKENKETCI